MCGHWTTGVVIELLGGNWTNKKKKTTQDSYNDSCHKDLYWKNISYKPDQGSVVLRINLVNSRKISAMRLTGFEFSVTNSCLYSFSTALS